ncbi:MAG: hypothetical protein KY476_13630 [Planctomycetes bacterium]|nr:hypothetical protein [Planctomycetota bacterium]
MSKSARWWMAVGSAIAAGLVGLTAILDIATGFPFNRSIIMDATFILGAGMTGYLAWESWRDLR